MGFGRKIQNRGARVVDASGLKKKSTTKIKSAKKTSTDDDRKGRDTVIRGLQWRRRFGVNQWMQCDLLKRKDLQVIFSERNPQRKRHAQ
ncbi:hypothetical protein U1Q18_019713 [Sarracenia purpurea var. burkii]